MTPNPKCSTAENDRPMDEPHVEGAGHPEHQPAYRYEPGEGWSVDPDEVYGEGGVGCS